MRRARTPRGREHAPDNAMTDPDEIARFHDRCSPLMRELLGALATAPGTPRPFGAIEDSIGWPRRRIASVLGGAAHLRQMEFGGRRPYRFLSDRASTSGRWEMWMDPDQAASVTAAAASEGDPRATPDRARQPSVRSRTARSR
jgi:hypothetical protein